MVDLKQMYVKQLLGVKEGESKMLGLLWNKIEDEIAVVFPEEPDDITKRGTLRFLDGVYDPLGQTESLSEMRLKNLLCSETSRFIL